jgi:hypothetical protein
MLLKRRFQFLNPCLTMQERKKNVAKKPPTSAKPASAISISPVPTAAGNPHNGQCVSVEAVRLTAYQKWEAAGKPGGDGVRFWLEAERELQAAQ